MHIDMLQRFQSLATYCYDVCLVEGEQSQLGILYNSALQNAPNDNGMYLALLDIEKRKCDKLLVYSDAGPGLRGDKYSVSDVLLRYDASRQRWVIAQMHAGHYIALRTLTGEPSGKLVLSPLCLLDREEDFEHGFNPMLDLQINEKTYSVLSHKAVAGHIAAPQVCKVDVVLSGSAWSALEDSSVIIGSCKDPFPLPPHDEQVILPEETYFDPYLPDLRWNSAALLVNNEKLATAENAMTFSSSQARLLFLASPEDWVSVHGWNNTPIFSDEKQRHWRVWITGWNSQWTTARWTYTSQIGLPADPSIPAYEYPLWPTIDIAVSTGPAHQSETVVAVLSMLETEKNQVLSEGICLDQETGEVLQTCSSPLGLSPHLCCCGPMMIGVDLLDAQWRLWTWPVLQQASILQTKSLSATCQSAYVYSMPRHEDCFWLIEDRSEGLAVSQYNAQTLEECSPAILLPEIHLLYTQKEERPLNGYRCPGLVPYRDTLFLLLRNPDDEIVLYQAQ